MTCYRVLDWQEAGTRACVTVSPDKGHIVAEAHETLSMVAVQLAELIGQMQHSIELQEALIGRNPYVPVVVNLAAGTSQTVTLPVEAHQIETVQVSGDTASTIKFFLLDGAGERGTAGTIVGQVFLPANNVAPPLVINCPVRPGNNNQLIITTSGSIVNGSCTITLARTRPGGFPYAG